MDADSGDDIWGAGEYKSKSEVESDTPGSGESSLTALGYGGGGGPDVEEAATASGTALLKSVLFKVAVTLSVFAVVLLLLVLVWRVA